MSLPVTPPTTRPPTQGPGNGVIPDSPPTTTEPPTTDTPTDSVSGTLPDADTGTTLTTDTPPATDTPTDTVSGTLPDTGTGTPTTTEPPADTGSTTTRATTLNLLDTGRGNGGGGGGRFPRQFDDDSDSDGHDPIRAAHPLERVVQPGFGDTTPGSDRGESGRASRSVVFCRRGLRPSARHLHADAQLARVEYLGDLRFAESTVGCAAVPPYIRT